MISACKLSRNRQLIDICTVERNTHAEPSLFTETDTVKDEQVEQRLQDLDLEFSFCSFTLSSEKLERVESHRLIKDRFSTV